LSSLLASSTPATSPKLDLDVVVGVDLRLAARERHHAPFGAAHAAQEEGPEPDDEDQRDDPAEHVRQPAVGDLARVLDAVLLELLGQLRVGDDAHGGERLALASAASASACRGRVPPTA
jgi:hypothetical protein